MSYSDRLQIDSVLDNGEEICKEQHQTAIVGRNEALLKEWVQRFADVRLPEMKMLLEGICAGLDIAVPNAAPAEVNGSPGQCFQQQEREKSFRTQLLPSFDESRWRVGSLASCYMALDHTVIH